MSYYLCFLFPLLWYQSSYFKYFLWVVINRLCLLHDIFSIIAKFEQNLENFNKSIFVVLEKDSDTWIENNPYVDILESALEIVETEVTRISGE